MVLNYKGIPYRESFLSYPDIRPFADHFNIEYDASWDPPRPTLPAIVHYDAQGNIIKAMASSLEIARYLDEAFPDNPVINPAPSVTWSYAVEAYQLAFRPAFVKAAAPGRKIIIPTVPPILDDRGREFFIEDRSRSAGGVSPLDWGAKDPEDDWKPFTEALQALSKIAGHMTESLPFLLGTQPCYVDFVLASFLTWAQRGSQANYDRIVKTVPAFGEHHRACQEWTDGQGEVVKWKPSHL